MSEVAGLHLNTPTEMKSISFKSNDSARPVEQSPTPPDSWVNANHPFSLFAGYDDPPGSWLDSLQQLVASEKDHPYQLRLLPDGGVLLNLDLVAHLANNRPRELISAMVLIAIDEARYGPNDGSPEYAEKLLRFLGSAVLDREWVVAELLHEFLEIQEDFDSWVVRLSGAHPMEHERDYDAWDYEGWEENKMYEGQVIPPEAQKDGLTFSLEFATKVALAESTRRAALIQMFMMGEEASADETEGAVLSDPEELSRDDLLRTVCADLPRGATDNSTADRDQI